MRKSLSKVLFAPSFRRKYEDQFNSVVHECSQRFLDLLRVLGNDYVSFKEFPINFLELSRKAGISSYSLSNLILEFLQWEENGIIETSPYETFILIGPRDVSIFPLAISQIHTQICINSKRITVVCPDNLKSSIYDQVNQIVGSSLKIHILTDEELLANVGLDRNSFVNSHTYMQIAKYLLVIYSKYPRSLVLDGDTVFLKSRNWNSLDSEILVIPFEYELIHANFSKQFLKLDNLSYLGYTTQCQIMSKQKIQEFIKYCGGLSNLIEKFNLSTLNLSKGVDISESPNE